MIWYILHILINNFPLQFAVFCYVCFVMYGKILILQTCYCSHAARYSWLLSSTLVFLTAFIFICLFLHFFIGTYLRCLDRFSWNFARWCSLHQKIYLLLFSFSVPPEGSGAKMHDCMIFAVLPGTTSSERDVTKLKILKQTC